MSHDVITVAPTTAVLGAVIGGVDLTQPLSDRVLVEVTRALMEHQVIFFRNQPMDPASLKRFGQYFGKLHIHSAMKGMDEHPEVRPLHADANSKHVAGEEWHTDLSCDPVPPMGSILNIQVLPPLGGDTMFASMYAAYDGLSDRMKAYLAGLTATHDGGKAFKRFNPNKEYNLSHHPIVRKHPVTGKKLIYVNRGFTTQIDDVPEREGEDLLRFLFSHCEKAEYQTRFRWEKFSVAFWDNRCTQHLAIWDYFPHTRSGIRVQIEGDPVLAG